MDSRTGTDPTGAGHDILLAVAGRLPDRLLWRLRDWLAAGAEVALRTALPRALVRHRVGITDDERVFLRAAVLGWGGASRQVDAVLHLDAPPEAEVSFAAREEGPGWDASDLVLRALVPTVGGVGELRRAWRTERTARRTDPEPPARVVLLGATDGLPALTGAVQGALRAQGETDPRVEVLGPDSPATAYHRAALAASEVLWCAGAPVLDTSGGSRRSPDPRGPDPRGRWAAPGELVRHG